LKSSCEILKDDKDYEKDPTREEHQKSVVRDIKRDEDLL